MPNSLSILEGVLVRKGSIHFKSPAISHNKNIENKINIGLTWVGVIMGEFLVAKDGLGFLIIFGGQTAQLDMVMLSIVILAILAFFMYKIVLLLEGHFKVNSR